MAIYKASNTIGKLYKGGNQIGKVYNEDEVTSGGWAAYKNPSKYS